MLFGEALVQQDSVVTLNYDIIIIIIIVIIVRTKTSLRAIDGCGGASVVDIAHAPGTAAGRPVSDAPACLAGAAWRLGRGRGIIYCQQASWSLLPACSCFF